MIEGRGMRDKGPSLGSGTHLPFGQEKQRPTSEVSGSRARTSHPVALAEESRAQMANGCLTLGSGPVYPSYLRGIIAETGANRRLDGDLIFSATANCRTRVKAGDGQLTSLGPGTISSPQAVLCQVPVKQDPPVCEGNSAGGIGQSMRCR